MGDLSDIKDMEFAFFHFPRRMEGTFNPIRIDGFPMHEKTKISTIYLICAEFNDTDTISIATSHTGKEVKGNILFIKSILNPKKNYLTLPHNATIILRFLININTGKFVFSLADNPMEVNNAIKKVKINLFYKLENV